MDIKSIYGTSYFAFAFGYKHSYFQRKHANCICKNTKSKTEKRKNKTVICHVFRFFALLTWEIFFLHDEKSHRWEK